MRTEDDAGGGRVSRRAAGLLVGVALAASVAVPSAALPQAPDRGLATFDAVWELVRDTHYDPTLNGVDWEAVRDRLRPRAAKASDVEQLRDVIGAMLEALDESHFALLPREVVDALEMDADGGSAGGTAPGDVGIEASVIDGQVLVRRVREGTAAADAGVRSGWVVESVGGVRPAEWLQPAAERVGERRARLEVARMVSARLRGPVGTTSAVEMTDGNGELLTIQLQRRTPPGELVKFGNLPPLLVELARRRLAAGEHDAGVIRFNLWLPAIATDFDRAVEDLRDSSGMIIDLRGNPGGIGGMVMGIAGHFVDEVRSLGEMKMRDTTLRFMTNPRRVNATGQRVEPFGGPVAILIDAATGSTSEVFAGGMQAIGRARVFGERSIGAVLPSMLDRLPNGDVLQHAIADFVTAAGDRLEGRGVVPDVAIELSRGDLLAGRDPVVDAALEWIVVQAEASVAMSRGYRVGQEQGAFEINRAFSR